MATERVRQTWVYCPDALAVLMAVEAPDAWARTTYHQWLRGHVHYAAGMFYPVTETHGVTVRVIPALCPPDQYHVLRGYVGGHRAAEVMYYHKDYGPAGTFPVFVDEMWLPAAARRQAA